jgi:hypothetical protein
MARHEESKADMAGQRTLEAEAQEQAYDMSFLVKFYITTTRTPNKLQAGKTNRR